MDNNISKYKRSTLRRRYPGPISKIVVFSFIEYIWRGTKIYAVHFIHVHFQFYLYVIAESHSLKHIQIPKNYP